MTNDMQAVQDDSIGTDPTIVQTIDSLDFEPTASKSKKKKSKKKSTTPNPDKKQHSILKKIVFTIVILGLMAGVAFGVYYYLSLGTGKNTPSKAKFTLDDKTIYVGENLSNNIMDYGNFNTVDISNCKLDIENVNTEESGQYKYSVTCNNEKVTANISVIERQKFNLETLFIYKEVNTDITINDFIKSNEDYTYYFTDETALNEYMQTPGGPYSIGINVKSESGNETIIYAALYVLPSKPLMYLTCTSSMQNNYTIIDKIAFNTSKNNMNISTRTYSYEFTNENDYYNYLNTIDNGKINIDNHEGIVIMNNNTNTLKVITTLTNEILSNEYGSSFPNTYSEISSYYRNAKKYSCTI